MPFTLESLRPHAEDDPDDKIEVSGIGDGQLEIVIIDRDKTHSRCIQVDGAAFLSFLFSELRFSELYFKRELIPSQDSTRSAANE